MKYRVSAGGIEWEYSEVLGGGGDLIALTRGEVVFYKESALGLIAAQINDEIAQVAVTQYFGGRPAVTVDQVRDALKDFPELFVPENNSASEKWYRVTFLGAEAERTAKLFACAAQGVIQQSSSDGRTIWIVGGIFDDDQIKGVALCGEWVTVQDCGPVVGSSEKG